MIRSVVVSGERIDVAGVLASEVADVAGVQQNIDQTLPGDSLHTKLILSTQLRYGYKRDSVKINANVARATNGETQKEVLGNGDGAQVFQTFKLNHHPLTFLSAPTASGVKTTLEVRVNDVLWREADALADLGPEDRKFITTTEDDGFTYVEFGNGIQGSRLPSGSQNVRAVYRSELGKGGNVAAGQISILASPPLGVTGVMNPLPASGGADPETRDSARRSAPLAVMSLDRLVSLSDYESYARTYAGIGKASSTRLTDGMREFVYLTIAGLDEVPVDPDSDLFRNLLQSILDFGDPHMAVEMAPCKRLLLALEAEIAIDPGYEWLPVKARIRAALLDAFGFERQELGEDVLLSKVLAVIQSVPGVLFSDVKAFDSIAEGEKAEHIVAQFNPAKPEEVPGVDGAAWWNGDGRNPARARCSCRQEAPKSAPANSGGIGQDRGWKDGARPDRILYAGSGTDTDPKRGERPMNTHEDRLFHLLPAIYRQRDEERGWPLRTLLRVIAEQVDIVEADIERLYDNWFIETCDDWVVPYIADLIGYQPVHPGDESEISSAREKIVFPRREVARTIPNRRRKGTLAMLDALAREVAEWPSRAVESYTRLSWTQSLNHQRLERGRTLDLRNGHALNLIGTPFDESAYNVDVRAGGYDIASVGLFVWRFRSYGVTKTQAYCVDERNASYTFSVLGNDFPLFTKPDRSSGGVTAENEVPSPIRRRAFDILATDERHHQANPVYYGEGKALQIWAGNPEEAVPAERIVPADLSKWRYRPNPGQVLVDPALGRIAFNRQPEGPVWVSYHYGFQCGYRWGRIPTAPYRSSRGKTNPCRSG